MLQTIQQKIICRQLLPDKQLGPLMKKEDFEQLHQQFIHVRRMLPNNQNAIQWRWIEYYQERLVRSDMQEMANFRFAGFDQLNDAIQNLLQRLSAVHVPY